MKKLEDSGLVICDNFNSLVIDKTKWYRICYEKLIEVEQQKGTERQKGWATGQVTYRQDKLTKPCGQSV